MKNNKQNGYVLVSLLIVVVVTMILTTALVVLIIINAYSASSLSQSSLALSTAESGVENAILRILRDPSYTGETLMIGDNSATITVSGDPDRVIVSEGQVGNFIRTVEVQATYNSGILEINSWQEVWN